VHKNIHISRIPSQKFTDKTDDNSFAQTANAFAMLSQHVDAEELEEVITEDGVRHSINTLRTNCSPGRDDICIEMFKATANTIVPFLTLLFNDIYNRGIFQASWSKSISLPRDSSQTLTTIGQSR